MIVPGALEERGVMKGKATVCPLCLKPIGYGELHEMVEFEDAFALANAGMQVEGATRSTRVNLFHIEPLTYKEINHVPQKIG